MKIRSPQVLMAMTLAYVSSPVVAFQASQSVASVPEIPPGPSMKETEAWIKRDLRSMGSDHIVTKYRGSTWGDRYEIESAVLSECVLTIRQVTQHEVHLTNGTVMPVKNRQTDISRITMKDVDVNAGKGLRAVEEPVGADSTKSKPGYLISVLALSDRGDPFLRESDGYAGGKAKNSDRSAVIRVRDQNMGNQAGEVLRRAAILCGAPNQPVETALAKTTPATQSSGAQANPASPNGNSVAPPEYAASARAGKYVRQDKRSVSYFELGVNGKFHLFHAGKHYDGNYRIQGDVLTVQAKNIRGNGEHFVGNTIVEADGTVWEKENVQSETQSPVTNPSSPDPSKMKNDDVIQLVAAGLSEQVVTRSIRQAPARNFDLTPTGLIALKKAGVSDAVIVVMQERDTPVPVAASNEAKTPPKYDATLASPPKPAAAPATQDGCSGIELMGLFTTDMRPASPLIIYLAKIRNGTNLTRIVTIEWLDMYGQAMESTNQVGAGQIVTTQLGANSPSDRKPINLRVTSCR